MNKCSFCIYSKPTGDPDTYKCKFYDEYNCLNAIKKMEKIMQRRENVINNLTMGKPMRE